MSKPLKGEWVWHFAISPDWRMRERGWRVFAVTFGKMRHDVDEGVRVRQRDVWGISFAFCYWLPFERFR